MANRMENEIIIGIIEFKDKVIKLEKGKYTWQVIFIKEFISNMT